MPSELTFRETPILHRIAAEGERGASISDLLAGPDLGFTKRTLQRRLDDLVSMDMLRVRGGGRSRRYHVAWQKAPDSEPMMVRETRSWH